MGKVKALYMRTLEDAYDASLTDTATQLDAQLNPKIHNTLRAPNDVDPWHLWDNDDVGDNRVDLDRVMGGLDE